MLRDTTWYWRVVHLVLPEVSLTWNSTVPYTLNDGPLWAGRGVNVSASAGLGVRQSVRGRSVSLVLAPIFAFSQNTPFDIVPGTDAGRSRFSNPLHGPDASADLPLRFGDRSQMRFDPGSSSLTVRGRNITASVTAAGDWWGPALRNALVVSNNAPGIPRVQLSSARPFVSRLGLLDFKYITGTLTESLFFDSNPANDFRALSGALFALRPAFDTTLSLGFSRVVYSPSSSPLSGPLEHSLDVFTRWESVSPPRDTTVSGSPNQHSDQISALFARWIFPSAGFEVYGEWARADLPRSATELLVASHHSGAYTIGFQWAQRQRSRDFLRLQAELSYLEQSSVFADRPPLDYYAGRVSEQGYTNRGQVIGAAIGPGSSSQWIAVDYIAPVWQAGTFLGRIRWENDALYRQFAPNFFRHDVSFLTGFRGALRTPRTDFVAELGFSYRINYLFQNGFANPGGFRYVDVRNLNVKLSATPR